MCWDCKDGYGGNNCETKCITHCGSCLDHTTCSKCSDGWFGKICEQKCPENCKNSQCNQFDGSCACADGWFGEICDSKCLDNCSTCIDNSTCISCFDGYFGQFCEHPCLPNCASCPRDGETCNRCNSSNIYGEQCQCDVDQCATRESQAHCTSCKQDGWYTKLGGCCKCSDHCVNGSTNCNNKTGVCLNGCEPGYYGDHCFDKCSSHCAGNETICNSTTGECPSGCEHDWFYSNCKYGCSFNNPHCSKCTSFKDEINHFESASCVTCADGYYKDVLKQICAPCKHCQNDKCNGTNGLCTQGCKKGWYSLYTHGTCDQKCNANCIDLSCDPNNGTCIIGCKNGFFGDKCQFSCPKGCLNDTCDQDSGHCLVCKPGLWGSMCYIPCWNCVDGTCNQTTGNCDGR